MPAGDGSILINVNADDKEARNRLRSLQREIEKTAKAVDTTNTKHNAIAEQLKSARDEAKNLQAELAKVNEQRDAVAAKMSANAPGRSAFAAVDPVEYENARLDYIRLGEEQARLTKELDAANKNAASLEGQEQKVLSTLTQQTEQLRQQKEQAGAIERSLAERAPADKLSQATQALSTSMKKGLGNILKWGIGLRSAFALMRRLRSAVVEGVKAFAQQDEETRNSINGLKSSLNTLKVSWGAAFAPILNAVAPILQKLISMLNAAANAIQAFFAILGGRGSYKKAIARNNELAESYGGAGGAAAEAEKQILGFDEINKLNDNSGGGGGGGGADSALDYIEEQIDEASFLSRLALSFKDVFFEWENLNPEQIAKKIVTGLFALLGGALAVSLGLGPGGILLLTLLGAAFGIVFSALTFNGDGRISKSEALSMIILAINTILGGLLGFGLSRSFKGAMIGATIGAGLTIALKAITMKKGDLSSGTSKGISSVLLAILNSVVAAGIGFVLGGGVPGAVVGMMVGGSVTLWLQSIKLKAEREDAFYASELGRQVQEVRDKAKKLLEVDEDLTVRINSITGEVDESTLVNLGAAQQLVEEIFNLDAIEHKTPEQIELLKQKIEALNGISLDGINIAFDSATGHVTQTRGEVQALLDDLLKQYEMEAMKDAYIESYKAQYEATRNVSEATSNAESAAQAYKNALDDVKRAEEEYNAALYAGEGNLREKTQAYDDAVMAAKEARDAATEAETALSTSLATYDTAKEKVEGIAESLALLAEETPDSGKNAIAGFSQGIDENVPTAEESMKGAAEAALEALHTAMDEHSPSGETRKSGENAMEGFALGVESKRSRVTSAITSAMTAARDVVSSMVDQMKSIWQSDWGRPLLHLPIFGLSGAFDFRTGATPQIFVRDWAWMARGGIVDGATLIGAGEDGKEAIVPLERHTEWINLVADRLIDRITQSNKLADYISGMPLPAMAMGQIVPPRALSGGGSVFSDGDIERLVSGITAAFTGSDSGGEQITKLYLDGRQIAEAVTKHQRRAERGR